VNAIYVDTPKEQGASVPCANLLFHLVLPRAQWNLYQTASVSSVESFRCAFRIAVTRERLELAGNCLMAC